VTTIPTRRLPKTLVLGALHQDEIKLIEKAVEEDRLDEAGQRGQYLWIRGLTRLQHQVNWLHVTCIVDRIIVNYHFSLVSLLTYCRFYFDIFSQTLFLAGLINDTFNQ